MKKKLIYCLVIITTIILLVLIIGNYYYRNTSLSECLGIITTAICSAIGGIVSILLLIQNSKLQNQNIEANKELQNQSIKFQNILQSKEQEEKKENQKREQQLFIKKYEQELNLGIEHIITLESLINNNSLDKSKELELLIQIKDQEAFIYWKSQEYAEWGIKEFYKGYLLERFFYQTYWDIASSSRKQEKFNYGELYEIIEKLNLKIKECLPIFEEKKDELDEETFKEIVAEQYELCKLLNINLDESKIWENLQICLINMPRIKYISKYIEALDKE